MNESCKRGFQKLETKTPSLKKFQLFETVFYCNAIAICFSIILFLEYDSSSRGLRALFFLISNNTEEYGKLLASAANSCKIITCIEQKRTFWSSIFSTSAYAASISLICSLYPFFIFINRGSHLGKYATNNSASPARTRSNTYTKTLTQLLPVMVS
jgi:hypothetical protein